VDRRDGTLVRTGTGEAVEEYIRRYEPRRTWRDAASLEVRLWSDAVELFAEIGPRMKVPVVERLRELHPRVSAVELDAAERHARELGARVLTLTRRRSQHATDEPSATDVAARMAALEQQRDDEKKVVERLAVEYPSMYPPVLEAAVRRAEYWWAWEI